MKTNKIKKMGCIARHRWRSLFAAQIHLELDTTLAADLLELPNKAQSDDFSLGQTGVIGNIG